MLLFLHLLYFIYFNWRLIELAGKTVYGQSLWPTLPLKHLQSATISQEKIKCK